MEFLAHSIPSNQLSIFVFGVLAAFPAGWLAVYRQLTQSLKPDAHWRISRIVTKILLYILGCWAVYTGLRDASDLQRRLGAVGSLIATLGLIMTHLIMSKNIDRSRIFPSLFCIALGATGYAIIITAFWINGGSFL